MGHSLAVIFESMAQLMHQALDPVPERMFHLLSGMILIVVGYRMRRSFE